MGSNTYSSFFPKTHNYQYGYLKFKSITYIDKHDFKPKYSNTIEKVILNH